MNPAREPGDPAEPLRWLLSAGGDAASASRKPLGHRDRVAGLLAESFHGLIVDDTGKGTCKRGRAELALHLVGDPVRVVELTLRADHVTAFRPQIERVATRAGWQLVDPDRGEILFPVPTEDSSGGKLRRTAAALLVVAAIGGAAWWIRSTDTSAPGRQRGAAAGRAAGSEARSPGMPRRIRIGEDPSSVWRPLSRQEYHSEMNRQQRLLAPDFRDIRAVTDMIIVRMAEIEFSATAGHGLYVDPAMLADVSRLQEMGIPSLPGYERLSRGGYRFSFRGQREADSRLGLFHPAYHSFVYGATPEPGHASRYGYALLGDTGEIHFSTNGRIPTAADPIVTDSAAPKLPE